MSRHRHASAHTRRCERTYTKTHSEVDLSVLSCLVFIAFSQLVSLSPNFLGHSNAAVSSVTNAVVLSVFSLCVTTLVLHAKFFIPCIKLILIVLLG